MIIFDNESYELKEAAEMLENFFAGCDTVGCGPFCCNFEGYKVDIEKGLTVEHVTVTLYNEDTEVGAVTFRDGGKYELHMIAAGTIYFRSAI